MHIEVWNPRVDRAFAESVAKTVADVVTPHAEAIDREDFYPKDVVRALAKAGFTAATFPTDMGGGGRPFAAIANGLLCSFAMTEARGGSDVKNTLGEYLVEAVDGPG